MKRGILRPLLSDGYLTTHENAEFGKKWMDHSSKKME
jgi:hypothetical protein